MSSSGVRFLAAAIRRNRRSALTFLKIDLTSQLLLRAVPAGVSIVGASGQHPHGHDRDLCSIPLLVGWTGLAAQPADSSASTDDDCEALRLGVDNNTAAVSLDYSAGKCTAVPTPFAVIPVSRNAVESEEAVCWDEIFACDADEPACKSTTPALGPLALVALLELLHGAATNMGVHTLVLRRQQLEDTAIPVLVDSLLGGNDGEGSLTQLDLVSVRRELFLLTEYSFFTSFDLLGT
jgi:hypothetical protein